MTGFLSPAGIRAARESSRQRGSESSESAPWWQRARRRHEQPSSRQDVMPSPGTRSVSPTNTSNSTSDGESPVPNAAKQWPKDVSSLATWSIQPVDASTAGLVNQLPTEILINVLQYLPSNHDLVSAMLVSKTWCLAAFPLIWQRPPISTITQFAKFVRTLNDPGALLPYAATVRRLVCSAFARDMTDELFSKVSCCYNLERLFLPGADLSEKALTAVFQHLPELISVDLCGIDGVNDNVARQIASICTQVQGLNLTRCKRLGDEGIIAIARNLKMLRRMKLHGCHRLTDRSTIALVRNCPLLSELDIMAIPQLSNDTTIAVFLNAAYLRDFKMKEAKDHEKLDYRAIPNLWELSRMEDEQLLDTLGSYPWYLSGSSAPKAQALSQRKSLPPNVDATLLRPVRLTLDVLRVVDFTSCSGLSDVSVENLVCNAPQLRSLTLTKCDNLTDASLDSISRLGKYIHYLHLGHVNQITDAGILQLSRNCTRLRYIDVANCSQLTDLSVVALATSLPKLRRIGLVKVTNVTDDGIMPLADRFLTLERIHLSWCDKITVRAIAYLLNRLPLLTHLSLSGIPAFKTAELQRFCRAPPDGLNDGQRGSFCVYSGPGVAALRNYLNSQVTGPELSDASSGRRSSASSTSSITIPGSASRGTAWDQGTDRPAAESRRDTPDQTSVGDVSGNAAMGHMFNLFKAASQSAPEHRQVSNGSRRPGLWETLENISLNEGSSSSQAVSGSTWNDTLTAPEAPSAEPSSSFTTVPSASEPTATTPSERPVQQPSSYAEDRSPLHNSGSSSYVASHTPQVVQPDTSSDMPTRERTVSARGRSENERILRYL